MNIIFADPFKRDYKELPLRIQKALDKALKFLMENPRHPSLRVKKLPNTFIWYGRVSKSYRFTFHINDRTITLRRAGTHDILNKERKNQHGHN